jgi:glycosyltransferase involved in cell wall biosynthesis
MISIARSPRRRRGSIEARRQGPLGFADIMKDAPPETEAGLDRRIRTLLDALGSPARPGATDLDGRLAAALATAGPSELWLALAVITGELPDTTVVLQVLRAARLDGPVPALARALSRSAQFEAESWPDVEVIKGRVVVDLHHTSQSEVTTGIQRVARETTRRWHRDHDVVLMAWTRRFRGLRRLTREETSWALDGPQALTPLEKAARATRSAEDATDQPIPGEKTLVPWHCTVLVPELPAERQQARRYHCLATFSGSTTGLIGYDLVPLMSAETSADGMAEGFALYLAAAAHFDRIAAISEAATTEYDGWQAMLSGSGRAGPDICALSLTVAAPVPSEVSMRAARDLITVGDLPVVLAVGSHEPRKNHMAVLQAAEALWREGLEFSLTFVGGHSWKSAAFTAQVHALESAHRPIQTIRALSDELLWAAYRVAYCTIFVSVHEGFGLPIAESLASGTPVVTSDFGSMLEIAARGGTLLVNPADDDAIADALRRLLEEPSLRDRLAHEAVQLQWRTWDDYAHEAWDFLVEGTRL